jgi:tripeptide aminopeptidase
MDKKLIDRFVDANSDELVRLIKEITAIPSPTGNEQRKAEYIKKLLDNIPGSTGAEIDQEGNVLLWHDSREYKKVTLAVAHIDTVFDGTREIHPEIKDGYLCAPSVGDNSANTAALILAARYIIEKNCRPDGGILFAFSVGEEGMGNLQGMRHLMAKYSDEIAEVIAVDGKSEKVMNQAVASKRFSVRVTARGGHSWHDFGSGNAIEIAAEIIRRIYDIKVPRDPRTTYNIGLFEGGRSVNSIAEEASFSMDMRSVDKPAVNRLEKEFRDTVTNAAKEFAHLGGSADIDLLAERPGGKTPEDSGLIRKVKEAGNLLNMPIYFYPSSTDANISISLGIPSVTFGIYRGEGAHTMHERIEIDSLVQGMRFLLYVLTI